MRAMLLTIVGIIIIVFSLSSYNWWKKLNVPELAPLAPSFKLLGVIDMNQDHGISIEGIKNGDDVLIVLDDAGFKTEFIPAHPELKDYYSSPFDIIYYDTNHDGEIDTEEAIWSYLYVVIYSDNGASYQIRHLSDAGIRAILASHLTAFGDHKVLLSDGDTRTMYEAKTIDQNNPPISGPY